MVLRLRAPQLRFLKKRSPRPCGAGRRAFGAAVRRGCVATRTLQKAPLENSGAYVFSLFYRDDVVINRLTAAYEVDINT